MPHARDRSNDKDEGRGAAHALDRRKALGILGGAAVIGAAPLAPGAHAAPPPAAAPAPIIVTEDDAREYARLKALDLADPAVVARRKRMPAGRIGNLSVSRLISGSNLISINMHARDLRYVSDLAARYTTEDRVFMTLKTCEEHGIDTIVLKSHNFRRFRLSRYWDEWGGRMQWIADVITTDIDRFEAVLVEHLELGASAAYVWGGASDQWYHQGTPERIIKAFELIKSHGVPAGIAAHRPEPIMFCEKEGLRPDFYMKTLHHDRYWSAHPRDAREFLEMYRPESDDHARYHDNLWCDRYEETVAFMQSVKAPWIAFKVLAAGAIPPEEGFRLAFENGADFICAGMFDFQVAQDAQLAHEAVAAASTRARPWAG